jgi:long-subunit fatty acid transport protein
MRLQNIFTPLSLLLLAPAMAFALGSRLPDQDAAATGRGDAFAATADDASALYYNPAGLSQLPDGFSSESGIYGIAIQDHYDPLHGQEGAHSSDAHEPFQPVPNLFLAYHPKGMPFTVGLGVFSPFGLKTEWPDDSSARQSGLYGSEEFISINPTISVQVTRTLSVAVGISANYVDAQLRQGLSPMPGDSFSFKGNGLAVGANAGILWKPTDRQAIGFSYHSPVSADLTGHAQEGLNGTERGESKAGNAQLAAGKAQLNSAIALINSDPQIPPSIKASLIAKATAQYDEAVAASGVPASGSFPTSFPTLGAKGTFKFPQYAVLGYSFRPTPTWNIEADVDWTDWDSLNTVTLNRTDGSQVKVPFDWVRSFIYELGVTHVMGDYKLSAGYMYSENSVPAGTFTPVIPDSARNLFSVGVGRSFGSLEVDLAYQLGLGGTRTVVNNTAADGRYSFLSNAVSISLGYHF